MIRQRARIVGLNEHVQFGRVLGAGQSRSWQAMGIAVALTLVIHQHLSCDNPLEANTYDMLLLDEIAHLLHLRACPAKGMQPPRW